VVHFLKVQTFNLFYLSTLTSYTLVEEATVVLEASAGTPIFSTCVRQRTNLKKDSTRKSPHKTVLNNGSSSTESSDATEHRHGAFCLFSQPGAPATAASPALQNCGLDPLPSCWDIAGNELLTAILPPGDLWSIPSNLTRAAWVCQGHTRTQW
jgi:hypothetical protein